MAQGASLPVLGASRFRYRVTLQAGLVDPGTGLPFADPQNHPVLESPFFDDITFAWQPVTGPKTLSWGAP